MSKTIIRGHQFQIYPTEEQAKQLDRYINLFRNVYNWGIAREKERYEQYLNGESEHKFYTFYELCTLFQDVRNNSEMYWFKDIPLTTARLALRNVYNGYQKFFKGQNKFSPKFKSKKKCKLSFNTRNDRFKMRNDCIRIEGMDSYISLGFDCGFNFNKCKNPTITKDNLGKYFISFNLEEESIDLETSKTNGIGIDLGVRRTFTLSTREIFNQPNEKLEKLERKRRKLQKQVSHDRNRRVEESIRTKTKYEEIPKSKRSIKRETKLKEIYKKIHNIKNTFYHTITKNIVMRNPEYVCMETLSVKEMKKDNKAMNKTLHDVSIYDIIQKMKYKCENNNISFIQAPMNFASTKTCSNCGHIKNMDGKHTYKCPNCGMIEDRDINAAINLMNFGSLIMEENMCKDIDSLCIYE